MIGEKLIKIIINYEDKPEDFPENEEWSKVFFITDKGFYEYAVEAFVKHDNIPNGKEVSGIDQAMNRRIVELKKDDESEAKIIFDNGDMLELDLDLVAFYPDQVWGHVFRYRKANDIDWDDEYYKGLVSINIR